MKFNPRLSLPFQQENGRATAGYILVEHAARISPPAVTSDSPGDVIPADDLDRKIFVQAPDLRNEIHLKSRTVVNA